MDTTLNLAQKTVIDVNTRIEEVVSSAITYIGESEKSNADPSEEIWRITRVFTYGGYTQTDVAQQGRRCLIWDDRTTYFDAPTPPPFNNRYSLLFDGTDEYVNFGDVSAFNFERTDTFSIAGWVKRTANDGVFFSKANASLARGYTFGTFFGFPLTVIRSVSGSNEILVLGSTSLTLNTWYHVAVTYDGSSTAAGVITYVNGVAETPTVIQDTLTTTIQTTAPACMGCVNGDNTFFTGNLDNMTIYNKVLSPTDILQIYNSGLPNDLDQLASSGNIIEWWPIGEGIVFPEIIGKKAYNGTMTNMESSDIVEDVP